MELFTRCASEPERLLAVTEDGRRYTFWDGKDVIAALSRVIGGDA